MIPDRHAPGAPGAPATPDAPALTAARRYAVLQPAIVDKSPLFEAMVGLVEARGGVAPSRVVELGVGTGGFLEEVARRRLWPESTLIGCDLRAAPLAMARERLAAHGREAVLCAGVNALDPGDAFYAHIAPAGSADMLVLSQFEHYAPNHAGGPLAQRHAREGRRASTKAELRRLAASRLRPGGWLFVIDDYGAATPREQAEWDRAWDAHVVRAFADPELHRRLRAVDPAGAESLARRYGAARPWAQRLALAARARARRRHRDAEELQPLAEALGDFVRIFGADAAGVIPHPAAGACPQFRLFWGRKKAGR